MVKSPVAICEFWITIYVIKVLNILTHEIDNII